MIFDNRELSIIDQSARFTAQSRTLKACM